MLFDSLDSERFLGVVGWVCKHWYMDACRIEQERDLGQLLRRLLETCICYIVLMMGYLDTNSCMIILFLLNGWKKYPALLLVWVCCR